ncbi:hypothetical protein BDU57DRAFT_318075 [Ampelomyces quisqualis]|uniref:Uncharacterized protein n=1 Tax=Ampelomyces quisqualis TaxID=50730 RepID=A0A6A5QDG0_AMPQU|nr:hypothetical protein BDU57DRAFT_318075 [Ampelomyces quisqualis]
MPCIRTVFCMFRYPQSQLDIYTHAATMKRQTHSSGREAVKVRHMTSRNPAPHTPNIQRTCPHWFLLDVTLFSTDEIQMPCSIVIPRILPSLRLPPAPPHSPTHTPRNTPTKKQKKVKTQCPCPPSPPMPCNAFLLQEAKRVGNTVRVFFRRVREKDQSEDETKKSIDVEIDVCVMHASVEEKEKKTGKGGEEEERGKKKKKRKKEKKKEGRRRKEKEEEKMYMYDENSG